MVTFNCLLCGALFKNGQAWSLHLQERRTCSIGRKLYYRVQLVKKPPEGRLSRLFLFLSRRGIK